MRSIEMKLVIGAAVVALLIFGTGGGFYWESRAFLADLDRQEQTHGRLDALEALLTSLQDAEVDLQGFLITGQNAYLEPYDRARHGIGDAIAALRDAYQRQPDQKERIALIEAMGAERLSSLDRMVAERRERGAEAAQRMFKANASKRSMDDLHFNVGKMLAMERDSLDLQRRLTHSRVRRVAAVWLLFSMASAGGFALSMALVAKQVRRNRVLALHLEHDAHHDFLTGLPNRAFFQETLVHIVARARREETRSAVLYMDLNGFKAVNDQLGHDVGDQVLIEVASRLRAAVRDADFLARLGGDEFAVLVPRYDLHRELTDLIARIEQAVLRPSMPFLRGRSISMSVGVATYPDDGSSAETLLVAADQAMYAAKRRP